MSPHVYEVMRRTGSIIPRDIRVRRAAQWGEVLRGDRIGVHPPRDYMCNMKTRGASGTTGEIERFLYPFDESLHTGWVVPKTDFGDITPAALTLIGQYCDITTLAAMSAVSRRIHRAFRGLRLRMPIPFLDNTDAVTHHHGDLYECEDFEQAIVGATGGRWMIFTPSMWAWITERTHRQPAWMALHCATLVNHELGRETLAFMCSSLVALNNSIGHNAIDIADRINRRLGEMMRDAGHQAGDTPFINGQFTPRVQLENLSRAQFNQDMRTYVGLYIGYLRHIAAKASAAEIIWRDGDIAYVKFGGPDSEPTMISDWTYYAMAKHAIGIVDQRARKAMSVPWSRRMDAVSWEHNQDAMCDEDTWKDPDHVRMAWEDIRATEVRNDEAESRALEELTARIRETDEIIARVRAQADMLAAHNDRVAADAAAAAAEEAAHVAALEARLEAAAAQQLIYFGAQAAIDPNRINDDEEMFEDDHVDRDGVVEEVEDEDAVWEEFARRRRVAVRDLFGSDDDDDEEDDDEEDAQRWI